MSSSTVAYSDSSIPSDDMLTSPRLNASGPYGSDADAIGEEVSENEYWTEAEYNAAMAQQLGPTGAPQAGQGSQLNHASKQAVSVSTVSKASDANPLPDKSSERNKALVKLGSKKGAFRGLDNNTLPGVANVTSGDEDSSDLLGNDGAPVESMNGPEQHGSSDDMQTDTTNGSKKIGLGGTRAAAKSTTVVRPYEFDGDQVLPVELEPGEVTGSRKSKSTQPKLGELDVSPFYLSMPESSRSLVIDGFIQIYLSSRGTERKHIHTRLAECQKKLNIKVASVADAEPSLQPVMAKTGSSGTAASDLSSPARPAGLRQKGPESQMHQPARTSAQALMSTQQSLPRTSKYGKGVSAHNGFRPGGVRSSRPTSYVNMRNVSQGCTNPHECLHENDENTNVITSAAEQHLYQAAAQMDAKDPLDLSSDFEEFEPEGSSEYVPDLNQSQQWHAPAASKYNEPSSDNQSHTPAYCSNSGPQTTSAVTQFTQGSSRDGLQPSTHPTPSFRPPPLFWNNLRNTPKRPHDLGWETGRSPLRRRVISSPGYIDSSCRSSSIPTSSDRSSSPLASPASLDRSSSPPTWFPKALPPESNDAVVDMYFKPHLTGDECGSWACIYQCPNTGMTCKRVISGQDRRNRFRHLATHAQSEEACIEEGVLDVEKALVFTQLKRVPVTCFLPGCDFIKEVWRTDKAREDHERETHPDLYEKRKQNKKKKTKRA